MADLSRRIGVMYEFMHRGDYFLAGSVAEEAGLYDQALALLNEAVKRHPDDSRVYSERGLVYAQTGQDELAIADLTKALALKETAMDYNNRGECYRHLKRFDLAKKTMTNRSAWPRMTAINWPSTTAWASWPWTRAIIRGLHSI